MLTFLYPISYLVSLGGLILWFYFQQNPAKSKAMSKTFLGGFLVYLFALAFAEGALGYKLGILARDLVVLGLVSQFFNFFKKNNWVFWTMMGLLYGSVHLFFYEKLANTFPQASDKIEANSDGLDANGELLIEIKDDHQIAELEDILEKYDLKYEKAFDIQDDEFDLSDYYVIDIPAEFEANIPEILNAFNQSGLTDWIEENEVITVAPIEAKAPPKVNRKFGINDPGLDNLWGFEAMEVDLLYQFLSKNKIKPQKKALIAILDTGIDSKHEDIKDNYNSTQSKYDKDVRGHGTHCAGIAASVTNNGKGIASFSPDESFVEVTSIKVLADWGGGTQRTIVNGIIEAADLGADVISMSLGGRSSQSKQRAYKQAVKYANKKGAIVLAAAGNSNANAIHFAPANVDGIIAVSAVDTFIYRASFSNYIDDLAMGIAAPGVKIYSTIPDNKYANFNGTSMATPYAAGLVGLMKSLKPSLTTKEVYKILNETGKKTKNPKKTGNLIYPVAAVQRVLK